jgi:hypothetical protein
MTFAAKGPAPGGRADPLELSSYGGVDLQANIPNQAPAQDQNQRNHNAAIDAADISCAYIRRAEIRGRLDGLLEIVAANAEAARLSLRIVDDRGARYHFSEVWCSIQEANRGFAELRALSSSHKEPSR